MSLTSGIRLGPYDIVAPLGAGGMGEVYRARDTRFGREVAIKVLPAEVAGDPERLARFEQEARTASALNHPGIVTVHDFATAGATAYLVTELLEGRSLRDVLAGGDAISVPQALDWCAQIARALSAAHERGIVHRDLKPDNLFVGPEGRVKILDFGLAKLAVPTDGGGRQLAEATTLAELTAKGAVLGTVGYMAPEQVRGESADERSDLFSFGCVLFEILTGERAFRGASPMDVLSAILRDEPEPLTERRAGLPPALAGILERCLAKDRNARYRSAREFLVALETVTASETGRRAPADAPSSVGPSRRSRFLVRAALAALVLVAAAVVWRIVASPSTPRTSPDPPIRSLVVLPLVNLSGDPEQEFFADAMTEALITKLARIKSLRVISRTSAMEYKGIAKPLAQIASELEVEGVVEGSVMRSSDLVRISAQLIDARSGQSLMAESYERELKEILRLQSEVAQEIVAKIAAELAPEEGMRAASERAVNPEAYEAFLRGTQHWPSGGGDHYREALRWYQRAIELDPGFAPAYAGLANTYIAGWSNGFISIAEGMPRAKAMAEKALELDPNLAHAHASLASIFWDLWDYPAAERHFQRAVELESGDTLARRWYGQFLATTGGRPEEAVAMVEAARRADPLSAPVNAMLTEVLLFAARYDEALSQARRTLGLDPSFLWTHIQLVEIQLFRRRIPEARAALPGARAAGALPEVILALEALLLATEGKRQEALARVDELAALPARSGITTWQLARICARLGEHKFALDWLERAYEERSSYMSFLLAERDLRPLHGEPRFQELARRLTLPLASSTAPRLGGGKS